VLILSFALPFPLASSFGGNKGGGIGIANFIVHVHGIRQGREVQHNKSRTVALVLCLGFACVEEAFFFISFGNTSLLLRGGMIWSSLTCSEFAKLQQLIVHIILVI